MYFVLCVCARRKRCLFFDLKNKSLKISPNKFRMQNFSFYFCHLWIYFFVFVLLLHIMWCGKIGIRDTNIYFVCTTIQSTGACLRRWMCVPGDLGQQWWWVDMIRRYERAIAQQEIQFNKAEEKKKRRRWWRRKRRRAINCVNEIEKGTNILFSRLWEI